MIQTIAVILSVVSTISTCIFIWRYWPLFKTAERIIKQWSAMMRGRWEEGKERAQLTEDQKSGRAKFAKNIRKRIPFDLLEGTTDNEVIGLLLDEDLMKGAFFLGKQAKEVISLVREFLPLGKPEEESQAPPSAIVFESKG